MAERDKMELLPYRLVTHTKFGWDLSSGRVRVVVSDPEHFDAGLRVAGDSLEQHGQARTKHLAEWPVAFLAAGHVHHWDYLNETCNILADRPGRIHLSIEDDTREPTGVPTAGKYFFKANDGKHLVSLFVFFVVLIFSAGSAASFSDGPDGKQRFEPPPQATELRADKSTSGVTGSSTSGSTAIKVQLSSPLT